MFAPHTLRSPLFTLAQAAFFKQLSLNQALHALRGGRIPLAHAIDGSIFRPAGAVAIPALELYAELDEKGKAAWRRWQRAEFEIPNPESRTARPAPLPADDHDSRTEGYVEG